MLIYVNIICSGEGITWSCWCPGPRSTHSRDHHHECGKANHKSHHQLINQPFVVILHDNKYIAGNRKPLWGWYFFYWRYRVGDLLHPHVWNLLKFLFLTMWFPHVPYHEMMKPRNYVRKVSKVCLEGSPASIPTFSGFHSHGGSTKKIGWFIREDPTY